MALPATTQILNLIGERLANISTTNGYSVTPKKITRGKMTPWEPGDLPAINYWPSNLENPENDYRKDIRYLQIIVEIHKEIGIHDQRNTPFSDIVDLLAADVVIGLNRSTDNPQVSDNVSHNLNNAVTDFRFLGYDYLIGEGAAPWCGAMIKFEIRYKTDRTDMFNYGA